MNEVDIIAGILLLVILIPLLTGVVVITLIIAEYLTVMASAWLFGAQPDWSFIDILNLPHSEISAIVSANWLLYLLIVAGIVMLILSGRRSKE